MKPGRVERPEHHASREHLSRTVRQAGASAICLLLLLSGSLSQHLAKQLLRAEQRNAPSIGDQTPLYLPSASHVKLITLGFNNLASDLLWFNTINYFGKQLRGTRDYQWLNQMCDLVTRLDPKKGFSYDFCANMLSWEAKQFKESVALLDRAVVEFPTEWRYLYLRGFSYWYFLEEKNKARDDLTRASKLPGAPAFLASLASRLLADTESPSDAVVFLQQMLQQTTDDNAKRVLVDKLNRALLSRDLKALSDLVAKYTQQTGAPPKDLHALVDAHLLRFIPDEPFGGKYELDPKSNTVVTSSGEEGLVFHGKTKDTGIFSMENKNNG